MPKNRDENKIANDEQIIIREVKTLEHDSSSWMEGASSTDKALEKYCNKNLD